MPHPPMGNKKGHITRNVALSIILKDYGVKSGTVAPRRVEFLRSQFIHFLLVTLQIVEINKPDSTDFLALHMALA